MIMKFSMVILNILCNGTVSLDTVAFLLRLVAYYHSKRHWFAFQVMNFSEQAVASYIAFVGILSVLAQVRD